MMLRILGKKKEQRGTLQNVRYQEFAKLSDLWYQEYKIIQGLIEQVNQGNRALKLQIGYKADKEGLLSFF